MNGAQKCMMIVYCVLAVCLTILYSFLFLALWPYRSYVGITLLVVIVFVIVVPVSVHARGKLNEQALRHQRYRYKEEIPFDAMGEPAYLPADAQVNTHRYYQPSNTYQQSMSQSSDQ